MSIKEVMEKEVFNVKDIMIIFQCGQNAAYKLIREIRSVSDRLHLTGKVHKKDYEDYINRIKKEPLPHLVNNAMTH